MKRILTVGDARRLAERRLPKIFFDYIDGGSFSETTLRANETDFDRYALEQRVLVDVTDRSLETTYLGRAHARPFALGPVGFTGLFHRRGEIAAARAAQATDIPFCLSNFAIATLEDVRVASRGTLYAQLYILRDRSLMEAMVAAAERCRVEALILTVDTAVTGVRERDERNGFRSLTGVTPGLALQFVARPRWFAGVLAGGLPQVGIVRDRSDFGRGALQQAAKLSQQIEQGLTWADLAWLRRRWRGRLVVKGILSADDARRARDVGADAVLVSNHGGRQLDGAPSTVSVLPEIVAAVGGEIDVLFDGGLRRGTQIVKALALGAHGVFLGRSYVYGLAAEGEDGVRRVLDLLSTEVSVTLALMGLRSIAELREGGRALLRERFRLP